MGDFTDGETTIVRHPDLPGIWWVYVDGVRVKSYTADTLEQAVDRWLADLEAGRV